MNASEFFSRVLDPYELRARLQPGLLVLFPLIAYFVCIMGPKHPLLTALSSLLAAIGGPYALGNIVRTYGQRAQEKLHHEWDGSPTIQLLRHRDTQLSATTKRSYHSLATSKLGVSLPSAAEEAANPEAADSAYDDVVDKLRNLTRDKRKYPLLFKELTYYGFNRNCYGVRMLGVVSALISLTLLTLPMRPAQWQSVGEFAAAVEAVQPTEALAFGIAVLFLLLWLLHFGKKTVQQASFSYGFRLLEALQSLPRPRGRGKATANSSGA